MNWLQLIALARLIFDNRDKIEAVVADLVALIQELVETIRGGTVIAMTEATGQHYAMQYSALAEFLQNRGMKLIDIIRLIIENKDLIQELIEFIREITKPAE